jgi:hypothetical protein
VKVRELGRKKIVHQQLDKEELRYFGIEPNPITRFTVECLTRDANHLDGGRHGEIARLNALFP